jgi:hypothetical protein
MGPQIAANQLAMKFAIGAALFDMAHQLFGQFDDEAHDRKRTPYDPGRTVGAFFLGGMTSFPYAAAPGVTTGALFSLAGTAGLIELVNGEYGKAFVDLLGAGWLAKQGSSTSRSVPPRTGQGAAPRTIPEVIAQVRAKHGLNCTLSVAELETQLPGGRVRHVGGAGMQHEVYHYQGRVIDPTARQYVQPARAGVWTEQELTQAGLRDAVDSGVFTPEQHTQFLRGLNRRFPGTVED